MSKITKLEFKENLNFRFLFLVILCCLSTILILHLILKFSAYGIDFTDEGFYLNWISNPYLYKRSLSQFGFIYHPIFNLIDFNISLLRRINFIITFMLATIFIYFLFNKLTNYSKFNKIIQVILSSGLSTISLTYLYIQTPSYNHLTLQGLILTGIGIILINNKSFFSYIVIGVGCWLTFMAKPTSGIGLAFLILIYLLITFQFRFKYILITTFTLCLLFLASSLIIDDSIKKFCYRYIFSYEISKLLQSGHNINSIFRIDEINISFKIKKTILIIFTLSSLCIFFEYSKNKLIKFISISFCFLLFVFIFLISLFDIDWNPDFGLYQPYQIFGILITSILVFFFSILKNKINFKNIEWSLFFIFLIFPFIFSLGTNNNYWMQSGIASIFWLILAFILIIPLSFKIKKIQILPILIIFSQVIAIIHIKEKIEQPYRYNESLRMSNSKINTSYNEHSLFVSDEFARYVINARNISKESGFKIGTPIIDLTGGSPGLLYLIGAKSIGTAWNIGGYRGSLDYAIAKYSLVNCSEIASSWILTEIKGSRSISSDLLKNFGINFPLQYELVGSWQVPEGSGGYTKNSYQSLYKPNNFKDINISCENSKNF